MRKIYKFSLNYANHKWNITEIEVIKEAEKRLTINDKDRSWIDKDRLDKNISHNLSHYNITIYSEVSDVTHFKAIVLQDLSAAKENLNKQIHELEQNTHFIEGLN